MEVKQHVWKKDDMAIAEYINNEFATCRILKVYGDNTADVLLYISGKKIKKISMEEMNISLSRLSLPPFIENLTLADMEDDLDEASA